MEPRVIDAERLSAALTELEDQYLWDAYTSLELSIAYEERAHELGDERLVARARLCQANMLNRQGEVAAAARQIWSIHKWAVEHDDTIVQARTHLLQTVWDAAPDIQTRTVDMHVQRLRAKLGAAGDLVETVRGFGYRLKAPHARAP